MSYQSNIQVLQQMVSDFFREVHQAEIAASTVNITMISQDIAGDYSIVLFPYLKRFKTNPADLSAALIPYLSSHGVDISEHAVIKGFLNITMGNGVWTQQLGQMQSLGQDYCKGESTGKTVMVEYCSPNTNKPLHLGHIRNILIGWSTAQILEQAGNAVVKVQIVNDRGIAICKSMLAWQKYGNQETPESTGVKGDHLVGKYYVLFETHFKTEYAQWQATPEAQTVYTDNKKENELQEHFFPRYKNQYFNNHSTLGREAKTLLQQWESGDAEVVGLWKKMNSWVYAGFDQTYDALDVSFDKLYYESDTYLYGKEVIAKGTADKIFYTKDDGSVWVDLEDKGLDQKLLLRSDGTAVYITQDIGTAMQRHTDFGFDQLIYVVGNEQDYHFKALFATMDKLGVPYADQLHHLSYGMVDLPTGKMKSREGTVVDADDLVAEVIQEAQDSARESQFLADLSTEEKEEVYRSIGLGALKYFILKVQAKKRMTFDPSQSVDMHGVTAPYIQNAYVRIQALLAKSDGDIALSPTYHWEPREKSIIIMLDHFGKVIKSAGDNLDPSLVANFVYDLAKEYHRFYNDHKILTAESPEAIQSRLLLSQQVASTLKVGMRLLGIEMPQKM